MNKKTIISIGASVLLASSLYAYGPQGNMKQSCGQKSGQKQMMMKQGKQHKKNGKLMKMVMMLDLSDEQSTQMKAIMQEHMKSMPNPHNAFSDSNFDKAKFIKLAKDKRDGKIERKAKMISKVYTVLNDSQKKNLKTILDMKDMKKQKMMQNKMMQRGACGGQNCNGRR